MDDATPRMIAFLHRIGIAVIEEDVPEPAFMPGLKVRAGAIVLDRARLAWPGDLLHEAGHIAVTDPAARSSLDTVSTDPAEEMAAIAWSYAAAKAVGLPADLVFHDSGYGGGGGWLATAFEGGGGPGIPMLCYWGMTGWAKDPRPFPEMRRWLR